MAAFALFGSARHATRPLPPEDDDGGARHGAPRAHDFPRPCDERRQARRRHLANPQYTGRALRRGHAGDGAHALVLRPPGGPDALVIIAASAIILILTHTRTALVGALGGIARRRPELDCVHAASQQVFHHHGGRGSGSGPDVLCRPSPPGWRAAKVLRSCTDLSGRTNFWGPLLAFPRNKFQEIFGFGLSNDTFGGLPIDSNWVDSYQNQGIFGVVVCAADSALLVRGRWLSSAWRAARTRPVLDNVLPDSLIYRDWVYQRFTVPARRRGSRIAAHANRL